MTNQSCSAAFPESWPPSAARGRTEVPASLQRALRRRSRDCSRCPAGLLTLARRVCNLAVGIRALWPELCPRRGQRENRAREKDSETFWMQSLQNTAPPKPFLGSVASCPVSKAPCNQKGRLRKPPTAPHRRGGRRRCACSAAAAPLPAWPRWEPFHPGWERPGFAPDGGKPGQGCEFAASAEQEG